MHELFFKFTMGPSARLSAARPCLHVSARCSGACRSSRARADSIMELFFSTTINTVRLAPAWTVDPSTRRLTKRAAPIYVLTDGELRSIDFVSAFETAQLVSTGRFQQPMWRLRRLLGCSEERALKGERRKRSALAVPKRLLRLKSADATKKIDAFAHLVISQGRERAVHAARLRGTTALMLSTGLQRQHAVAKDGTSQDILARFLSSDETISNSELRDVLVNFAVRAFGSGGGTARRPTCACAARGPRHHCVLALVGCVRVRHPPGPLSGAGGRDPRSDRRQRAHVLQPAAPRATGRIPLRDAEVRRGRAGGRAGARGANTRAALTRLHPSVPYDVHTSVADDVLPDGTRVPAGNAVSPAAA
jgi:hypothetical protein